ncbi:hypothetical protein HDU99_010107 [Rhizoclosmatium hyalinum]|nr:hypothetical protein HDU99_010107 [Rhizoclosmatium hyalinum]
MLSFISLYFLATVVAAVSDAPVKATNIKYGRAPADVVALISAPVNGTMQPTNSPDLDNLARDQMKLAAPGSTYGDLKIYPAYSETLITAFDTPTKFIGSRLFKLNDNEINNVVFMFNSDYFSVNGENPAVTIYDSAISGNFIYAINSAIKSTTGFAFTFPVVDTSIGKLFYTVSLNSFPSEPQLHTYTLNVFTETKALASFSYVLKNPNKRDKITFYSSCYMAVWRSPIPTTTTTSTTTTTTTSTTTTTTTTTTTVAPTPTIIGLGPDKVPYFKDGLNGQWYASTSDARLIDLIQVPGTGFVGVAPDNTLWYTNGKTINSWWTLVPNSAAVMSIAVLNDKTTYVGVGMDHALYTRNGLFGWWNIVPNSLAVYDVTVLSDGRILGVGLDKMLYTRQNLNANWVLVPNSGYVSRAKQSYDGSILGIGTDKQLYRMATLGAPWQLVPNSCCVISFVAYI